MVIFKYNIPNDLVETGVEGKGLTKQMYVQLRVILCMIQAER